MVGLGHPGQAKHAIEQGIDGEIVQQLLEFREISCDSRAGVTKIADGKD